MANFDSGKMKRKGFDEVYDNFSDLSLSAPATKIRRLDSELPPIMEVRTLEHPLLKGDMDYAVPLVMKNVILPPAANEERALVLYKPIYPHFCPSLNVDPELLSDLKNSAFLPGRQNFVEKDFVEQQPSSNYSLAVIPWAPQFSPPGIEASTSGIGMSEDGESMDIEGHQGQILDAGIDSGMFCQWQQQHCMIPEHSHFTSTPVLGYGKDNNLEVL